MRVMISAAGSPAAISILRHVRSLGHAVIGIDAAPEVEPLGRAFCDEFHVAPLADSPAYLDFLCRRLAEVDVFLPFIDEELLAIVEGWQHVPPELAQAIAVSDPDVLRDCIDKRRFQHACVDAGLPIAPEAHGAPAFFKPRHGRGGKGVIEARDERMFEALQGRDGVLQQAISGQEFTVDAIFDRDGKLVATSPRRRLRSAGVSTVGSVGSDDRLHDLARQLGERWRFRYAINFQVIRDAEGRDWLLELNPRLAGSAIFSTLAGCDPFAATLALWNGEPWHGSPRPLRVWRHWQERTDADLP
jgi:carbamoyl-phosphate synthase large subunit